MGAEHAGRRRVFYHYFTCYTTLTHMQTNFKRNLFLSIGGTTLLLVVSAIASFWSIERLLDSYKAANDTQKVVLKLNESMISVLDAQTSMRGYLVTGKAGFMIEYDDVQNQVADTFSEIRMLIGDDSVQQKRIDDLRLLHAEFFSYLNGMVEKRRVNPNFDPDELHEGKRIKAEIQALSKRIESSELERLSQQF